MSIIDEMKKRVDALNKTEQTKTVKTSNRIDEMRKRVEQAKEEGVFNVQTPTFRTAEEALNYAKQNNIKVAGNTNVTPKLVDKKDTLDDIIKENDKKNRIIKMFSERDGYDYEQDYYNMINGRVNSKYLKGITRKELLSDGIEKASEKYTEALVAERKEQSFGTKFNKNVIEPIASTVLGFGEGSGGGAVAKNTIDKITKMVSTIEALKNRENPKELYQKLKSELPSTNKTLNNVYKDLGNHDVARNIGNTTGYITTGTVLTGLGVPPTVAYGMLSGANEYGKTDDVGDIAFETVKGMTFGKLNQAIGGVTKGFLSKIPMMNTAMQTANPTTLGSGLQFGANIVKNVIAGASGMYGASAITGEVGNIYNLLRGRDVTKDDWLVPIWSEEALTNAVIGGIIGGISGTASDMKTAKNQIKADYNRLGQNLNTKNNEIKVALQKGDVVTAKRLNNEAVEMINKFTNTQYLGYKLNNNAKNTLMNFWNNVAYANTQANYKPTILSGGTAKASSNNLSNLQLGNTIPKISTNNIQLTQLKAQNAVNFTNKILQDKVTTPNISKVEISPNKANGIIEESYKKKIFEKIYDYASSLDNEEGYISEENIQDLIEQTMYNMDEETTKYIDSLYEKYENDEIDDFNPELYALQKDAIENKLSELGYKYDKDFGGYSKLSELYDSHEKILEYLDNNNIDYEVSKSINSGVFPSIYVKNNDGDIVMRIANHYNSYGSYNTGKYTNQELMDTNKIIKDIQKKLGNDPLQLREDSQVRYDNILKTEVLYMKYSNGDKVEIIKNPSNKQIDEMRKEAKSKYDPTFLAEVKDEPLLRKTYDSEGNVYYWQSIDSTHYMVENFLKSKYANSKFNQNQQFVYDKKEKNKEALQLRDVSEVRYDAIQDGVDITKNREYNTRTVERKQEPRNYVYKKITDKDKARVSSDYLINKDKYKDKNFVHFDDVSYGYIVKNDEVEIIRKFKGSQKFIRDIEEAWENGVDKLSNGNIKVAKSIRSAKRGSNTSDGIGRGQSKSGNGNREIARYGGQQRGINSAEIIKNNGDTLKNSEQQGSNFMSKNIQGLEKYTENEIKNIISDYIQNLIPDIAIKEIELNGSRMRGDAKSSSDLDVVVEYDGDISEDALFNILNEDSLEIDGIKIDINPITASKSGTMTEYMKKSKEYDDYLKKQDELYDAILEKQTDNQGRELSKGQQERNRKSAILDGNGLLMKVYHGTKEKFSTFDLSKLGKNMHNAGNYGDGFYFTPNKPSAEWYSGENGNLIEAYLNIEKPFKYTELSKYNGEDFYTDYIKIANLVKINSEWAKIPLSYGSKYNWGDIAKDTIKLIKEGKTDSEIDNIMYEKYGEVPEDLNDRIYYYSKEKGYKTLREALIENGYDGIINSDDASISSEIVAFYPNQIKSVDNTNPTDDPDILKDADMSYNTKDGFYSQLENTIINKMPRHASSKDVMNLIQKNGVKQDEIAWTGIDDFLNSKETVTKEEVLDYIRANQIEIEDYTLEDMSNSEYEEERENNTIYKQYATKWKGGERYRETLYILPNVKGAREYHSSHWSDENNVLAHTRLQDYKDKNGDSVLFIEEIQSDMHQEGRKHGYIENYEGLNTKINDLKDEALHLRDTLVGKNNREINRINNRQYEIRDEQDKIVSKYYKFAYDEGEVWDIFNEITKILTEKNGDLNNVQQKALDLDLINDDRIETLRKTIHLSAEDYKKFRLLSLESVEKLRIAHELQEETRKILKSNEKLQKIEKEIDDLEEQRRSVYNKIDSKFPFKKNWHEFVLRKIINEAVKQGYDKVAWTTGKQQNDRYNLAKYVDAIEYYKNDFDKSYDIYIYQDGAVVKTLEEYPQEQLEELVGKEITNKIINEEGERRTVKSRFKDIQREGHILEGLDLEIGGDGMKGFYDKIIPEYLNKYLKKWDGKVEEVIIPDGLEEHKQQGFAITPKMIEAVNTVGQPLYEKTTEGQRANINRIRNAVMDILGVEETGNKEVLDAMAIKVNYALNRNMLDDNEIKRIVNDVSEKLVNVVEPTEAEKNIKSFIKGTRIYVPESVKKDIADWNAYRKSIFGTLKLSNDKQNIAIDSFYKELNEMFGELYFPNDIVNETDELRKIVEVVKTLKTKRVKFEKYFKEEYGKEAWKEVLEDIEKELKDIREEVSYETNEKNNELKFTPELFTALNNIGVPIEMLEQDKDEWVKGIAQFFSDDYKYYEQNLKDIEKQNLETGSRTTNYILNKRRIDVLLGRTPRNEKYSGGVSPKDIRENIEKSINKKIGVKGFRAKAYGVYKPYVDTIRVKNISNIETELHELGHRIDFKILKNIINNESSSFRKELNALSHRAFLNTYDTAEMKSLSKQIEKTKDTIKNLEKYLDERNLSKRANPNSKVRQNARARLEKAKTNLPKLEAELEKAIISNTNEDNIREGWAEATKRFVVDNESFIKEYPETARYILNEMDNNKALNKQLTDLITLAEKYINSTSEEQLSAIVSVGEDTDKQDKRKFFDQYMYQMHDDLWDIKKWQKNISKAKGKKYYQTRAEDNLYTLMRLNKANEDVIINAMKYGLIDDNGYRVTKGISDIIEKMKPETYQKLRNFLVTRRTLDYFAKGLDSGVQVADAIALINEYSKDKKLVQMANDLTEMQNETLQYLGKDFIKKDDLKELRKWNRLYIPMKRVFDGKVNSSTGGKQLSKLTKERTGSQRDIIDPLESIIQNTAILINKKRQNDWLKKVAEQINESGYADIAEEIDPPQALKAEVSLELFKNALEEQGVDTDEIDLEVVARIFNPKLNDEATMTMGFMDDGKLRAIQFKDKNVYKIVSEGTGNVLSDVFALADKLTGLLRLGATQANLEFAIPNVISDTMSAWIYSESGFIPAVDSIKGVIDYMMANYDWANNMLKNTEYGKNNKYMYDLYMQSGATMSTRVASYRPEVQNYLKEIFGKNATKVYSKDKKVAEKAVKDIWEAIKKAPNSVQDILTAIPELSEQGTRFANFKKDYNHFKKKGYDHKNALVQSAINARDITTDFSRMGNYYRAYNRLKAFSSARAQSIYRFAEGVAKMPKKVLPKIGIMVAISIAILKASIDADRKEYEEITDQTRKDNFIIALPNGEFLKIKKPQGTVRSIINFFEMLYGIGTGIIPEEQYEKEWQNWLRDTIEENSGIELDLREGRDFWQVMSGAVLPTAFEPMIENSQNVDFYYGNPIIPYGKEGLEPTEQYDENTSQTAIIIGKIFNTSPAKLENAITGWFAGVGQQALDISDTVLGKLSDDIPEQPAKDKSDEFILKRFFADPYKNSDSVSEIYDMAEKLEKLQKSDKATESELETLKKLEQAKDAMSNLNKKIKETRNSLSLNAEEKKDKINELQELRTDTARYYLGKELINEKNKDQIELFEFYPPSTEYEYKSSNGLKVKVQFNEKDQKKYAKICKDRYHELLKIFKDTLKENPDFKKSILTSAREYAKDIIAKEVYERGKRAK